MLLYFPKCENECSIGIKHYTNPQNPGYVPRNSNQNPRRLAKRTTKILLLSSNRRHVAVQSNLSDIHTPASLLIITKPMEQHAIPTATNCRTTRGDKPRIIRIDERHIRLRIRTGDTLRRRPANIIQRVREAVSRVEQEISITVEDQVRGFDQWTIIIRRATIENLHRIPDGRDAVFGDLLQQNRRGDKWLDAVVAVSAIADAVTVNLEDNVTTAVFVFEACGVD